MHLIPILFAFLVGLLPAWCLLRHSWQESETYARAGEPRFRNIDEAILIASLAFPLGAGVLGLIYFGLLAIGVSNPWVAMLAAAAISGASCFRRLSKQGDTSPLETTEESDSTPAEPAPVFSGNWILAAISGLSVGVVLIATWLLIEKSPHGAWDSWAIWSLRGKFLAAGGEFWRNAVDAGFGLSHPEYPVMLSSFLGWSWQIAGVESAVPPQATALAYLVSLIGMVGASVSLLRRASLALLAIPAFLSPIVMVTVPASLYADLPMGVYATGTAVLLVLGYGSRWGVRYFLCAGLFASMCVWTKEEGLLHLAVAGVVASGLWLTDRANRASLLRSGAAFALAAAPGALCFYWFRIAFALPTGTRFSGKGGSGGESLFSRLLDLDRYSEVLKRLWETVSTLGPFFAHPALFLVLGAVLLGFHRKALRRPLFLAGVVILALLWGGYLASFLLLAGRIGSVLSASLHRLLVHTWPLLVILFFAALRAPEDLAISVPMKLSRQDRKQAKASASKTEPDTTGKARVKSKKART